MAPLKALFKRNDPSLLPPTNGGRCGYRPPRPVERGLSEPADPESPRRVAQGRGRFGYTRVTTTGTGRQTVLQTGECCWA